jgi:hypothetical protein
MHESDMTDECKVLVRQLERRRRIWKVNIKTDFKEIGCDRVEWILLVRDGVQWQTLLNTVMSIRVS